MFFITLITENPKPQVLSRKKIFFEEHLQKGCQNRGRSGAFGTGSGVKSNEPDAELMVASPRYYCCHEGHPHCFLSAVSRLLGGKCIETRPTRATASHCTSRAGRPVGTFVDDGRLIAAGGVLAVKIEREQAEHRDHKYQDNGNDETLEKNHLR